MPTGLSRYNFIDHVFVRTRGIVQRSVQCSAQCSVDSRCLTMMVLVGLLFGGSQSDTHAQLPDSLSRVTRVSLLTIYPGEPIYSAFGHSAYRFVDPEFGFDIVFNYGTFDSTDPFFIPRFMYGKLDYLLSYGSMDGLLRGAALEKRSVVEQNLQLTPEQVENLYQTLRIKARPENRTYRYDFLFENCSTILLDRIQDLGTPNVELDSAVGVHETFRDLLQPYLNHRTFYDLGIAIVLGSTLDKPATYRERAFLPLELMRTFDQANVQLPTPAGDQTRNTRLVSATDTLFWVPGTGFKETRDLELLWVFALMAMLWIGIDVNRFRKNRDRFKNRDASTDPSHSVSAFSPFGVADHILFGVAGFAGLIISFVWFISAHTVGVANWNILWAAPTHVLPALFLGRFPEVSRIWYFRLSAAAAFGLIVLQPVLGQKLHPALFPIVVLIGWRSITVSIQGRSRVRNGFRSADRLLKPDADQAGATH